MITDYTIRRPRAPRRWGGAWLQTCPACGRTGATSTRVSARYVHRERPEGRNAVTILEACDVPLPVCARDGCGATVPDGGGLSLAGLAGIYCSEPCAEMARAQAGGWTPIVSAGGNRC